MRALPIGDHAPVFAAAEAYAQGWTPDALRHAVRTRRIRRLRRGVYVAERESTGDHFTDRRARAVEDAIGAWLAADAGALSHRSASLLHGVPTLSTTVPCLTFPGKADRGHHRIHVHRGALPAAHLLDGDVPITAPARTIVDLGREHGFAEAVAAGDHALRTGIVDRDDLSAVLARCRGWPFVRRARAAVDFLDPRSESVLESLSRIAISRAGLPVPELQAVIRDRRGAFVARCDFLFRFEGNRSVVGEADGLAKYDQAGVDEHEQRRRQELENLGFGFVRWQKRDLSRFDQIAARIRHTARHLPPTVDAHTWPASRS